MRPVTEQEFWMTVGPMDVHPRVDETTLKGRHHESDFETRSRAVVGRVISDSHGIEPSQYFLA